MKSCEATGKSIEQAVQNALLELKAAREDVDIKILSEGGFLKKAKVLVSISEDALDKYEKREKLKETIKKEESDEDFAENFVKSKISTTEKEESKAEKKTEKETSKETKKTTKTAAKEEKKTEKAKVEKVDDNEELSEDKEEKTDRKYTAEEFVNGVLDALGSEGQIERVEEERVVRYNLLGENLNDLIGHHGDCMMALSHLMSLVCKNENKKRVILDVENYRQKRVDSLTALAKRTADKVAKSGRYFKFEPMEASERRILHLALQDDDRVTTLSKGEEPRRYLIVFPKEYKD